MHLASLQHSTIRLITLSLSAVLGTRCIFYGSQSEVCENFPINLNHYLRLRDIIREYQIIHIPIYWTPYYVYNFWFLRLRNRIWLAMLASIIAYTYLYYWRIKRYTVYPLRYYVLQPLKEYSTELCKNFTNYWFSDGTTIESVNTKQNFSEDVKLTERASAISKFPAEIWIQIAEYEINPLYLMIQNRLLFEIFAPFVYEEVHGILVLSDLEKMRNSDQCFLKNGPDIPGSGLDNYGIYLRSKKSQRYDYEALDIAHATNLYAGGPKPTVQISMKGPTIITANYSKLRIFMTEIILNPESIMKKYLQKFSIDYAILSDLDKFIGDFEESIGYSIDQLDKCEITRYEETNIRLPVYSGYEEFSQKRVAMRPYMLKDLGRDKWSFIKPAAALSAHSPTSKGCYHDNNIKKFEVVYVKELLQFDAICHTIMGVYSSGPDWAREGFQRDEYEKRASRNVQNSIGSLSSFPPYATWNDEMSEMPALSRKFTRLHADSCSKRNVITKRTFLHKEDLQFIFDTIVYCSKSFQKDKYCFLINGVEYLDHSDYCEIGIYHREYLDVCQGRFKAVRLMSPYY